MFRDASAFNQPIGKWNTAKVTDMSDMFFRASAFNQPIGNWNTAAVTSMVAMFLSASAFNQPIGAWNTAAVTDMNNMFRGASAFNQPIGNWNTAKVTDMVSMFSDASAFNQKLCWTLPSEELMSKSFCFPGAPRAASPHPARARRLSGHTHGGCVTAHPLGYDLHWSIEEVLLFVRHRPKGPVFHSSSRGSCSVVN